MITVRLLMAQIDCNTDIKLPNCGKSFQGSDLSKTISFVTAVASVVCVLIIVLAGLRYITSSGNPDSLSKSKNQILYALIGLIVSISAYAIIRFVLVRV